MYIDTFKVFCDLAETGSFSKAAVVNSITQSAVSQQIRALETKFQVTLVERGRRNFALTPEGSGYVGDRRPDFMLSADKWYRGLGIKQAPDGSVYFLDWHKPLIGHMQHHLRDPNRDHVHGRIYRITYEGRPLLQPVQIAGAPIPDLLNLLKAPEDSTRYRAKIELSGRDRAQVVAALPKYIESLDKNSTKYQHNLMEGLWVYQWMDEVNEPLLKQMLRSPDFHARAAATRVLCAWREKVKEPLALLKIQVNDDHPRVRLEGIRACSYFKSAEAFETALDSQNKPSDYYLKYALDSTLRTLDKYNKK